MSRSSLYTVETYELRRGDIVYVGKDKKKVTFIEAKQPTKSWFGRYHDETYQDLTLISGRFKIYESNQIDEIEHMKMEQERKIASIKRKLKSYIHDQLHKHYQYYYYTSDVTPDEDGNYLIQINKYRYSQFLKDQLDKPLEIKQFQTLSEANDYLDKQRQTNKKKKKILYKNLIIINSAIVTIMLMIYAFRLFL